MLFDESPHSEDSSLTVREANWLSKPAGSMAKGRDSNETMGASNKKRDSNETMGGKKETSPKEAKKDAAASPKKDKEASQGFKLGRPKPPPPPKPTPAEVRMAKHCEALTHLCSTFEELARMEHAEHTLLHRVRYAIPQRLAAIDKELDEVRASRGAADASAAMQRNELDDVAALNRIRELEQEEKVLQEEMKNSRDLADELDKPRITDFEKERWTERWKPEAVC